MRSKLFMAVLVGFVLILYTAPLSAAGPTEAACALLTQARVSMLPSSDGAPNANEADCRNPRHPRGCRHCGSEPGSYLTSNNPMVSM